MQTHSYEQCEPCLYAHLQRIKSADLKIHKVTTGISQSTGASLTIESIVLLNSRINLEKYKHPTLVDQFYHKKSNQLIYDQFTGIFVFNIMSLGIQYILFISISIIYTFMKCFHKWAERFHPR